MWEGDLWVALRAARAGAEEVLAGAGSAFLTQMKGVVDPVTEIDERAETAIRASIASHFPDDSLLGEEGGGEGWQQGRVWIIDPLDGTINFVHSLPHFSVSVALWDDGVPLIGVVIDVMRQEEFVAVRGEGARLNDLPIGVSETPSMNESVIATGFPYDRRQHAREYLEVVANVLEIAQGIRRLGSAALDLAWVACGRVDAYWEFGIKPWDAAAGTLLVAEAGGFVTDHRGASNNLDAGACIASNGNIHDELRAIVSSGMPEHLR
ncbi:MAG: inositol monophosphatase family protein [Acidimicrobiia bacterium]